MHKVPRLCLLVGMFALSFACAHGRYVNVDPIYEPVQQVHQAFYRASDFDGKTKRVAVMDFKGREGKGKEGGGHVFADMLATELFASGVKVVERQNMDVLLAELKMVQSGKQELDEREILRRFGKLRGVDIIIVGGIVSYAESVGKHEFQQAVALPFLVWEWELSQNDKHKEKLPPANAVVYRWKPNSYKTPAGLPVHANIYASARGIDVATGRIVWINTVSVHTSGITQVTGLERLGKVMAGNFTGTFDDRVQLYIYSGEKFTYPDNWEEVQTAWRRVLRRQQGN